MVRLEIEDIDRFMRRFSLGRDSNPLDTTGSPHFLRIKVPGGFLTSQQFRRIAEITTTYSKGRAEITNRQDIQLHWIEAQDALTIFSIMDDMGFTTDMCGQGFSGARYGDARNIVCCPVSGYEGGELINGAPLLKELSDFFIGNPDFQDMPRKFKFSISGCGCDCTRAVINDLAFVAVTKDGEVGFTLLAGGSIGASLPGPRLAEPTGVFIRPDEAFDVAVASIEIHRDNSSRESKAKARFKWLLNTWGLDKFLSVLEQKLGTQLERYSGPVFIKDTEHEGIQPQSQEGYDYVNIPLMGGNLTSAEMLVLARLAEEYGTGELRLTPTQNVIIPNIQNRAPFLASLRDQGFTINGSRLRWNSMGCASDFCGKTVPPHAKGICHEIVEHLEGRFNTETLSDAGFRIYVSGCPNNCCANLIAEIGLAGRLSREKGKVIQNYDLILGGSLGRNPVLGRLILENVPAPEIPSKVESLLAHYFQDKNASESLGTFCRNHSIDTLQQYLITEGE